MKTSMRTIELAREAWADRLNEFTAIHEYWLVSVEVLGELGAQPEISNLPLLGVSIDRLDHDDVVVISVARSVSHHLTHVIEAVTRIFLQKTDDGADAALELESADGTKTILRFRASALPETVDGIATRPALGPSGLPERPGDIAGPTR
jgi:hypothetical protein